MPRCALNLPQELKQAAEKLARQQDWKRSSSRVTALCV